MTSLSFRKATKSQSKLRMALDGPSGSGKTFTGLTFATALAQGGKVAVIDTERGSASKYADMFSFDVLELDSYHPQNYMDGIDAAEQAGYAVVLIDSLSHAWEGEGGVLELHEQATKRDRAQNSYTAWRDVTPIHRALVDAILQSKCHIIVTMRSKTEYVMTPDDRGRQTVKKVGMAPVQRAGMEYEFDIVADLDTDHNMVVSKSRCFAVADAVVNKPKAAWMGAVIAWLTDGAPVVEAPVTRPEPADNWHGETNSQPSFEGWLKTNNADPAGFYKFMGVADWPAYLAKTPTKAKALQDAKGYLAEVRRKIAAAVEAMPDDDDDAPVDMDNEGD
jgi:hypothetical protein